MNKVIKKNVLSEKQIQAIEHIACNPEITNVMIGKLVNADKNTIGKWRRNAQFIDKCYDRFMEVSGVHLPNIILAMVREAMEGNVRAAELILKMHSKYEDSVTHKIKVEAPFMQHLKTLNDSEEAEIVTEDAIEIGESFNLTDVDMSVLPERHESNDTPSVKNVIETNRITEIKKEFSVKKQKDKKRYNKWYLLRKRAKKVGLKPLPPGKPNPAKRRAWERELVKLEKENNIRQ